MQSFDRKIDIKLKHQRKFVYDIKQQKVATETVFKNFPLIVMYWVKKNKSEDDHEV